LGDLVERDMLNNQVADLLMACVRGCRSCSRGRPGSGKTTLLSRVTAELDPSLRVVLAEEVFEADIPAPNVAKMQTRAARAARPRVDLRRLVAGFLCMVPEVPVVQNHHADVESGVEELAGGELAEREDRAVEGWAIGLAGSHGFPTPG
jgi:pilus assembly protein CpaF